MHILIKTFKNILSLKCKDINKITKNLNFLDITSFLSIILIINFNILVQNVY